METHGAESYDQILELVPVGFMPVVTFCLIILRYCMVPTICLPVITSRWWLVAPPALPPVAGSWVDSGAAYRCLECYRCRACRVCASGVDFFALSDFEVHNRLSGYIRVVLCVTDCAFVCRLPYALP